MLRRATALKRICDRQRVQNALSSEKVRCTTITAEGFTALKTSN